MQPTHLFEYAVIRVVPRVEREEFVNVGVIVYCSKPAFLQLRFEVNVQRLTSLCHGLDIPVIQANLAAMERICNGETAAGTIGKLDNAARFRWLTATRSTVVQCSKVHPGLCNHPATTLEQLYNQLVL